PSPSDGAHERPAQDGVHDADARRRERRAPMLPAGTLAPLEVGGRVPERDLSTGAPCAVLVADMLAVGAVLNLLLAAAAPHLRVQPVDRLGLDPANLQPADRRSDVLLDLADVAGAGLPLDVEHLQ